MTNEKIIIIMSAVSGFMLVTTVSVMGWMAVKVWDMTPTVTETAHRVDRIVEALPEVKIRIAMEDLDRNITAALLTTEPFEATTGKWQAFVHYLDFSKGTQNTYVTSLKGADDQMTSIIVSGVISHTDREKLSLQYFDEKSSEANKPTAIPLALDKSSSYAILRSNINYNSMLTQLLGKSSSQTKIAKGQIKWDELAKRLQSQKTFISSNEDIKLTNFK